MSPAELRAAQLTQLDQLHLQNSGKGGGKGSARTPPRDSAREEEEHRLLPTSHTREQVPQHYGRKEGAARDAGGRLIAPNRMLAGQFLCQRRNRVHFFRKHDLSHHQPGPIHLFKRLCAERHHGAFQSHRTLLAKWQSEVFNQTHRWTKKSVSG